MCLVRFCHLKADIQHPLFKNQLTKAKQAKKFKENSKNHIIRTFKVVLSEKLIKDFHINF